MLTAPEIVKLIKAHNILSKITIPAKDRKNVNALIELVESNNYTIDHLKKSIKPKVKRGKQITLKQAEEITKPKPKTELQKQKAKETKQIKEEKKKKEIREAKKGAVEKFKKGLKDKSIIKDRKEMKPKQPKQTQKLKSQKEDEVRPKEKVGRPKVDPKKIKVIQPKKKVEANVGSRFGYDAFKKKLDQAVKVSGQSLDKLTKKSKERLTKIEQELKDGTNKRETLEIKIGKSQIKPTGSAVSHAGDKFNLTIKFGLNEGEELTRLTKNKIPRATILPFEKENN